MIYYYEYNENYDKYIRHSLGKEEVEHNKAFTIDGSGDSNKVVVYCDKELALAPNTIVFSQDENDITSFYWWVVQEDKATLIDTNIYRHDIQLIGAIEWFKFKFAYTGTFYYHRYSYFEVMNKLLYSLWKPKGFSFYLNNFSSILDGKKLNQKFSFRGYTVRSCLNEIEKALNVEFKFNFIANDHGHHDEEDNFIVDYNALSYGYFDIIDKNPKTKETYNIDLLDEKYQISQFPNRSYATRVVGRVSNATSGAESVYPKTGFAKLKADGTTLITKDNACLILPYNIDRIQSVSFRKINATDGYYSGVAELHESTDKIDLPLRLYPNEHKFRLKEKFLYDLIDDSEEKEKTLWYEKGKNVIHNFTALFSKQAFTDIDLTTKIDLGLGKAFISVYFYPVIDEALITSNTQVNCDDVIYNQTGSNADLVLTKDFVNSYATSISTGTLTRIKYHNKESECFKVGSVFVKDNERYVVSSVSIDKYKDKVRAEYKLSKDYVAKTELVSADGSIESYAIPQNNIVKRIQEYKTLIRFRDGPSKNKDKYMSDFNFVDFTNTSRNDYVLQAKCITKDNQEFYVGIPPVNLEMPKSSALYYDFYDNNFVGFVSSEILGVSNQCIQYPLNYVDSNGEFEKIELKLKITKFSFNVEDNFDTSNYPLLTKEEYDDDDSTISLVVENNYKKDGYETPVFLYTREYQDYDGFIFGDNVSKEATTSSSVLSLYTSEEEITREITSTDNLEFVSFIKVGSIVSDQSGNKYFAISFTIEEEFNAFGKNLVVMLETPMGDKKMVFAKNNCEEFETNYDENNLTRTYVWRIYIETFKV